jgi:hypothetical protein
VSEVIATSVVFAIRILNSGAGSRGSSRTRFYNSG